MIWKKRRKCQKYEYFITSSHINTKKNSMFIFQIVIVLIVINKYVHTNDSSLVKKNQISLKEKKKYHYDWFYGDNRFLIFRKIKYFKQEKKSHFSFLFEIKCLIMIENSCIEPNKMLF